MKKLITLGLIVCGLSYGQTVIMTEPISETDSVVVYPKLATRGDTYSKTEADTLLGEKVDFDYVDPALDDIRFDIFPRGLEQNYGSRITENGWTEDSRQMFIDMTGIIGGGTGSTVDIQNLVILNDIQIVATNVFEEAVQLKIWNGATYTTYGYYLKDDLSEFWMAAGSAWTIAPLPKNPAVLDVVPSYPYPPLISLAGVATNEVLLYESMLAPTFEWDEPSAEWVTNKGGAFPDLVEITNGTTRVLIRNYNAVLTNIDDITATCVWNSQYKNKYPITLISEKHAIGARHVALTNGTAVSFVSLDNAVWSTTIAAQTNLGVGVSDDITIYQLATNHPSYISRMDIGNTYADICSSEYEQLPVLYIDQMQTVQRAYSGQSVLSLAYGDLGIFGDVPYTEAFATTGDSGRPLFFLQGGEFYLSWCFYSSSTGDDAYLKYSDITNAVAAWGDTNIVHQIDLKLYESTGVRINEAILSDRFRIPASSNAPPIPVTGDVYIDVTATNTLKVWNGLEWKSAW